MSDLIPVLGGKPWEVIPIAEKTIAEQAARIKELEAERDALKVDAAKQFQAGHAAGLEDAAVCAWSWLMDNARKGGVTPAVDARFGVCDAIRAMKEPE